ncbi:MAG TPA: Rid family detoxifying hydrolase, partial [Vicinamibacterales bacterium]|nr:Rid family detoxifying hydrolase [Vicinamibacterales bacterium]
MRRAVTSDGAPAPVGPYSQAIRAGNLLFCSGQIALDPATGEMVAGGVAEQTRQVLRNLGAVLEAAGATYAHVVRTTVYLADLADFAAMNAVYGEFFAAPAPAR